MGGEIGLSTPFLYCSLRSRRWWTIFWRGDAGASAISPAGLLLRNAGEMPGCDSPRRRAAVLPYSHAAGAKTAEGEGLASGGRRYGAGYAPVWIGASSSTTAFFNGQIDELRISRGILAPSEFLHRGTLPFVMMIK